MSGRIQPGALVFTLLVHAGIGGAVVGAHAFDNSAEERARLAYDSYVSIEAGLAIKKKSSKGKRSRLPQKDLAPKVKPPDGVHVAQDPNAPPTKKDDKQPPPDALDPNATFEKFRKQAEANGQAAPTGEAGADDENVAGDDEGSEFGTMAEAKGDPYVGELAGRLLEFFEVPTVVADEGLKAHACVRLDAGGKIADRLVERKSGNTTFDRAVEAGLKKASDMETPVPEHLKELLVKRGICVSYKK